MIRKFIKWLQNRQGYTVRERVEIINEMIGNTEVMLYGFSIPEPLRNEGQIMLRRLQVARDQLVRHKQLASDFPAEWCGRVYVELIEFCDKELDSEFVEDL